MTQRDQDRLVVLKSRGRRPQLCFCPKQLLAETRAQRNRSKSGFSHKL